MIEKELVLKKIFSTCSSSESRYEKIIELGRSLTPLADAHKISENLVIGCQSKLYLVAEIKHGLIYFSAASDSLISAGLAYLLISVYSGESPETVIKSSPSFLNEIGIPGALSPSRSNGLSSLYLKMQQEALKILVSTNTNR